MGMSSPPDDAGLTAKDASRPKDAPSPMKVPTDGMQAGPLDSALLPSHGSPLTIE